MRVYGPKNIMLGFKLLMGIDLVNSLRGSYLPYCDVARLSSDVRSWTTGKC